MPDKAIEISGRWYYLFDTYESKKYAYETGKYFRKTRGFKFYVRKVEVGFWFPVPIYALYLTREIRIW